MHRVHSTREEQLASAASSSLFPITIIIYLLAPDAAHTDKARRMAGQTRRSSRAEALPVHVEGD